MTVSLVERGAVLIIRVERSEKCNAWNRAVIDAVANGLDVLAGRPDLRVGVLCAEGPNFSSGLDLADVLPRVREHGGPALAGSGIHDPFGLWKPRCPKPLVLAVQGISYTLAIELALAFDVVVAAQDVRFRQMEVSRGILPFGGATLRAPLRLGWGNAMRWLLTAEEFGADEALRIGLVQDVCPPGEQEARAIEIATAIARQAPLGIQATLETSGIALNRGETAGAEQLSTELRAILGSADAQEGLASFLERRDAVFSGT